MVIESVLFDAGSDRPFKKNVLADEVYYHLKAKVMDHAVPPNAAMSIDVIARELGVSPTPVREAMIRLESDSLVVKRGSKGYFTNAPLTVQEFEDLWTFRMMIEPWAARQAALSEDDTLRDALRSEIDHPAGRGIEMDYSNYRAMQEHDHRFHDLIFQMAGNQNAREAFERAHVHVRTFRIRSAAKLGTIGLNEHKAIAEAILARDSELSSTAIEHHISASRERLLPFLDT